MAENLCNLCIIFSSMFVDCNGITLNLQMIIVIKKFWLYNIIRNW